jgi:hypothetical protein
MKGEACGFLFLSLGDLPCAEDDSRKLLVSFFLHENKPSIRHNSR